MAVHQTKTKNPKTQLGIKGPTGTKGVAGLVVISREGGVKGGCREEEETVTFRPSSQHKKKQREKGCGKREKKEKKSHRFRKELTVTKELMTTEALGQRGRYKKILP